MQDTSQLLFLMLLVLTFVLLVVVPQRNRLRAAQRVRESLRPGDRVVTTAGLHATLVRLDGDTVVLEVAPDVHVRWATAAIAAVLEPTTSPPD